MESPYCIRLLRGLQRQNVNEKRTLTCRGVGRGARRGARRVSGRGAGSSARCRRRCAH